MAAKDSIYKLNIAFEENLKILNIIKEKMKIFSTRLEDSQPLDVLKEEKIFCLVLGNEARGVKKAIQAMSDDFIKIETGNGMESLNVASAAAIIFMKFVRI